MHTGTRGGLGGGEAADKAGLSDRFFAEAGISYPISFAFSNGTYLDTQTKGRDMVGGAEGKREADVASNGLQMPPEQMLDLARKAAELVVERIDGLPRANAWEGEFRRGKQPATPSGWRCT